VTEDYVAVMPSDPRALPQRFIATLGLSPSPTVARWRAARLASATATLACGRAQALPKRAAQELSSLVDGGISADLRFG
jgi:hypothetical protein